ncbi:hypothetical protein QBC38DRAFT_496919 [Podospora fimiseda]|uniref:Uncharacterized protein n=1 Tax=Podospora fimiseda TaxID=252190 RepID=A0AAN7BV11_9PEZI|nr:hypothetical protein QBC38DRAFT_496919 [Podospora fimiseda]
MTRKTAGQPNGRMTRSLRCVQGMDYISQLRGLDWVRFYDYKLKERGRIKIRDWSCVEDLNSVVTMPKVPSRFDGGRLENLRGLFAMDEDEGWGGPTEDDLRVMEDEVYGAGRNGRCSVTGTTGSDEEEIEDSEGEGEGDSSGSSSTDSSSSSGSTSYFDSGSSSDDDVILTGETINLIDEQAEREDEMVQRILAEAAVRASMPPPPPLVSRSTDNLPPVKQGYSPVITQGDLLIDLTEEEDEEMKEEGSEGIIIHGDELIDLRMESDEEEVEEQGIGASWTPPVSVPSPGPVRKRGVSEEDEDSEEEGRGGKRVRVEVDEDMEE